MAASHQPRPFQNNGYLPNGVPDSSQTPGSHNASLSEKSRIIQTSTSRILCVADVRGELRTLNDLARKANADYIIHTGDFGFYDQSSLARIAEKTLKHVAQYSPLLSEDVRRSIMQTPPNASVKDRFAREQLPLSELQLFLNGTYNFEVPVYTVWGACEDVAVLEKLRNGEYKINNLTVIDEAHSKLLEVGGLKLRLLGLGGAVVMHKLFDNGEGKSTMAGGQGTMWTTLLQIGELVDTATRSYDPTETRILVTHASPAREGLLNQLAVTLKIDFSISAGLHFRYGSSYNEFSVNPTLDHYRGKLAASKASFNDVWDTVRQVVEPAVAENEVQQRLLNYALDIVNKMPGDANGPNQFASGHMGGNAGQVDELAFKNMWNFNLADAAFGYLVLEIEGGRIGTEMKAQGFNFGHRGQKTQHPVLQADIIKPSVQQPPMSSASSMVAQPPPPYQASGQLPPQAQARPTPSQISPAPQVFQQARAQPPPARTTQSSAPPQQQQSAQAPASRTPASGARGVAALPPPTPAPNAATSAPAETAATSNANGSAAVNGVPAQTPAADSKPDGAAATDATTPATDAAPEEKKSSTSIFIQNVNGEEEARNLFSEEDRAKISRIEKRGLAWLAFFNTPEEMQAVLNAAPAELKTKGQGYGKPHIKEGFPDGPFKRREFGAGSWGQRANNTQNGPRTNGTPEGEGVRGGRGGFRGSRGGRGGERGGRGGRGRGGMGKEGASSAAPSPAPPAASGTS